MEIVTSHSDPNSARYWRYAFRRVARELESGENVVIITCAKRLNAALQTQITSMQDERPDLVSREAHDGKPTLTVHTSTAETGKRPPYAEGATLLVLDTKGSSDWMWPWFFEAGTECILLTKMQPEEAILFVRKLSLAQARLTPLRIATRHNGVVTTKLRAAGDSVNVRAAIDSWFNKRGERLDLVFAHEAAGTEVPPAEEEETELAFSEEGA